MWDVSREANRPMSAIRSGSMPAEASCFGSVHLSKRQAMSYYRNLARTFPTRGHHASIKQPILMVGLLANISCKLGEIATQQVEGLSHDFTITQDKTVHTHWRPM